MLGSTTSNLFRFIGLFTVFNLITPSEGVVEVVGLLRLTCNGQIHQNGQGALGAIVCMELVEIRGSGLTLTGSDNDDRKHLDPLVKQINDDREFTAEDFRNNGNAGTLRGTRGGPRKRENHYRIDSQISSRDLANINYQVGDKSKAKCLIRYLTDQVPRGFPANTRLTDHFPDNLIKAMVQDGLDVGVLRPPRGARETEIQWRVIPVGVRKVKNKYRLSKNAVRTALREEYRRLGYSNDIMREEFEIIRRNDRQNIEFYPKFTSSLFVDP